MGKKISVPSGWSTDVCMSDYGGSGYMVEIWGERGDEPAADVVCYPCGDIYMSIHGSICVVVGTSGLVGAE